MLNLPELQCVLRCCYLGQYFPVKMDTVIPIQEWLPLQKWPIVRNYLIFFSFTGCTAPLGPGLCFFSFMIILHTVGLLGRVISSSQGLCIHTGQHKPRINTYTPNIHALSGIRSHDPSFRASEDSTCLRPLGHCDRLLNIRVHNE
jgi:hypothetical protein